MLVPYMRRLSSGLLERLVKPLPPHPNVYTLASLPFAALGLYYALLGAYLHAMLAFVASLVLDALDGAVARVHGRVSRRGAFLDSTCDRVVDAMLAYGLKPVIGDASVVLLTAMLVYSYVRARGEAILCTRLEGTGILERGERSIVILAIYAMLAAGLVPVAVVVAEALTMAMCVSTILRAVQVASRLG